jgi:hypothetical protein
MDNLADLLAKRLPQEPPEIQAIKRYVQEHFREAVGVMVRGRDVVITVRSSALAGALRMRAVDLDKLLEKQEKPAEPGRRLIFRVGSVS